MRFRSAFVPLPLLVLACAFGCEKSAEREQFGGADSGAASADDGGGESAGDGGTDGADGSDGGPPPASDPDNPLVGTWLGPCVDSQRQTFEFTADTISSRNEVFADDDSACSGEAVEIYEAESSYVAGTANGEGIQTLDMTLKEGYVTVTTDDAASRFSSASECGVATWTKDNRQSVDVKCDLLSGGSANYYDLIAVNGDEQRRGAFSDELDGTSAEKRPTTLSDKVFTRQ